MAVQFELPEELLPPVSDAELSKLLKRDLVLHLFREGRASAGTAAEALGLTREGFRALLVERGLPYFDLLEEELEREFAAGDVLSSSTSGR